MDKIIKYAGVVALIIAILALLTVRGAQNLSGTTNYDDLSLSGDLTVDGRNFTLTTSNTSTSTAIVGCVQTYGTSTATSIKLLIGTIATSSPTTAGVNTNGLVGWAYGTCS